MREQTFTDDSNPNPDGETTMWTNKGSLPGQLLRFDLDGRAVAYVYALSSDTDLRGKFYADVYETPQFPRTSYHPTLSEAIRHVEVWLAGADHA